MQSQNLRQIVGVCLLVLAWAIPTKVVAQDMWSGHCTFDASGRKICAASIPKLMEISRPAGAPKVEVERYGVTSVGSEPGVIWGDYRTVYEAPASESAPKYFYNSWIDEGGSRLSAACSEPILGPENGCPDEQTNIDYIVEELNKQTPVTKVEVTGQYSNQFQFSANGRLDYGTRSLLVTQEDGTVNRFILNQFRDYTCRAGEPNDGQNTGVSGSGSGPQLNWKQLCGGKGPIFISSTLTQRNTCAVNRNPCFPTTGDKARFETDFYFGGLPFIRSYHSLQQVAMPGVAQGWWLSYGEQGAYSHEIDEKGYVDLFAPGSDGRYHSILTPNKFGFQSASGFTVVTPNGLRREYDNNAVLMRVYSTVDSSIDVSIQKDSLGRTLSLTDAHGRIAKFHYTDDTALGVLARVDLPDGTAVEYSYSDEGDLTKVTYADGRTRTYVYDEPDFSLASSRHMLTGILDANAARYATFRYDSRGRVTASALHSGLENVEATTIQYGLYAATVTSPAGGTRRFEYTTNVVPNPTTIRMDTAGTESYTYDAGLVTSKIGPTSLKTTYAYTNGFLYEQREGVGSVSERRVTNTRDASGLIGESKTSIVQSGVTKDIAIRRWLYNARGQVVTQEITDVAAKTSRATKFSYCEGSDVAAGACPKVGLLLAIDGPRVDVEDVTRYAYRGADAPDCLLPNGSCPYRKGDLWKVTNAKQQGSEILAYDLAGRVLSARDANGVITDREYNAHGQVVAVKTRGSDASSELDDRVVTINYDDAGLVSRIVQPDATYLNFEYDRAERLVAIENNVGERIEYKLDPAGHRVQEQTKDPQGSLARAVSRVFNQLGQLETVADAYGAATALTYDAAGQVDRTTDPQLKVTDTDFDVFGNLTRAVEDIGGINAETTFRYDPLGRPNAVIDPKALSTTYSYNGFGELTQVASPDTGITTYAYDSAGNLSSRLDARHTSRTPTKASFAYDSLNRRTGIIYGSTTPNLNVNYFYDGVGSVCGIGETFAVGRLTKMVDGSGATEFCYDRFGNVTRKSQVTNGKQFVVVYKYLLNGELSSVTYPSGMMVVYQHDGAGRPQSVLVRRPGYADEMLLTDVKYYPFGPGSQLSFGASGRTVTRLYDKNYRPLSISDPVAGGLNYLFGWDDLGRLSDLLQTDTDSMISTPLRRYEYDGLNRLTTAKDGSAALRHAFSYDRTGNRLTDTNVTAVGQSSYSYASTSHRLTGVAGKVRTYDAAGNTLSGVIGGVSRTFTYDVTGRMSTVKIGSSVAMNYAYNGKGEQVRRFPTQSSPTQNYEVYDESGRWLGEYDASGAPGANRKEIIWLGDEPIGIVALQAGATSTQQLYEVQADHLGSPRVVVDPTRQKSVWLWPLESEPFGTTPPDEDPDGDGHTFRFDLRMPGQRFDSVAGIFYNYNRSFDAAIGRYLESDPLGLLAGNSTYAYVNSSPVNLVDPLGLAGVTPRLGTFSPGYGGNAAGRRFATREFLRSGQGNLEWLNDHEVDEPDPSVFEYDSRDAFSDFICIKVMCLQRAYPGQCSPLDAWVEMTFAPAPITVSQVYKLGNCRCDKIRHVTFERPEAGAVDLIELLGRWRQNMIYVRPYR